MTDPVWLPMLISATLATVVTPIVARWAARGGILDRPTNAPDRKRHKRPMPLLGGVVLFLAFSITVLLFQSELFGGYLLPKHAIGLIVAMGLLAFGGALDDARNLPPWKQILFPLAAALVVIASGIGITHIDNPIGPDLNLENWSVTLFTWGETPYRLVLWADLFTLGWLAVLTYTTKLLDGLDGLVSGLGVTGSLILFLLSLRPDVMQPETAILAAAFAGACAGFLLWNWHPARAYLGEGGSTMVGFVLGTLAIISGAKIATALLIVALPLLDHAIVVIRRFLAGNNPFTRADRSHLHLRLIDRGIPAPVAAGLLIATSTSFGILSIVLPRETKGNVLFAALIIGLAIAFWMVRRQRHPNRLD